MASQTYFYPCNETSSSICTKCNAKLTSGKGTDGTSGSDDGGTGTSGSSAVISCEAYCDSSCNSTYCQSCQAYCEIEHQFIKNHGDIGDYPIPEVCGKSSGETNPAKYTIISTAWTKNNWNSLINKLDYAEIVGKYQNQGESKSVSISKDIITASIFNDTKDKLSNFNVKYDSVTGGPTGTLITASIANAMRSAFNDATFNTSVCDLCNTTGSQTLSECGCNCPTCSSCPTCSGCPSCSSCPSCSCTCPSCSCTSCSCNCSSCSCNCSSCSCNCSSCASPSGK